MKQIRKIFLTTTESQIVKIQPNAEVIHFGFDETENLCLWFIVDPDEATQCFTFHLLGTGDFIPPNTSHIGSFIRGSLEWHLFA